MLAIKFSQTIIKSERNSKDNFLQKQREEQDQHYIRKRKIDQVAQV